MEAREFDEADFFQRVAKSGVRALLIGRRALIALGLPVSTFDYDLWIHRDDAAALNAALAPLELFPNRTPDEARKAGRYVLENGERVDVLVAQQVSTVDGIPVQFDELWSRRQLLRVATGVDISVPSLDDLILTKRFAARAKDLEDIKMLTVLKSRLP